MRLNHRTNDRSGLKRWRHLLACAALAVAPATAWAGSPADEWISLARQSERYGKLDDAERLYEQVLSGDPDNQIAHHRLGVLSAAQGEIFAALGHFEDAERGGPPYAELLNDYGGCLFLKGELAAAELKLRAALALDPEHRDAKANLELVLAKKKEQRGDTSGKPNDNLSLTETRAAAEAINNAKMAAKARELAEAQAQEEVQRAAKAIADAQMAAKARALAEAQAAADLKAAEDAKLAAQQKSAEIAASRNETRSSSDGHSGAVPVTTSTPRHAQAARLPSPSQPETKPLPRPVGKPAAHIGDSASASAPQPPANHLPPLSGPAEANQAPATTLTASGLRVTRIDEVAPAKAPAPARPISTHIEPPPRAARLPAPQTNNLPRPIGRTDPFKIQRAEFTQEAAATPENELLAATPTVEPKTDEAFPAEPGELEGPVSTRAASLFTRQPHFSSSRTRGLLNRLNTRWDDFLENGLPAGQ